MPDPVPILGRIIRVPIRTTRPERMCLRRREDAWASDRSALAELVGVMRNWTASLLAHDGGRLQHFL